MQDYRGRRPSRVSGNVIRLGLGLLAGTALASGQWVSVAVAQQSAVSFSIPPSSLGAALSAFGDRANLQVLYAADLARGVRSPGVSGNLTPEQALSRLLAGTGLSYRFTNANTVTIARASAGGATGVSADGTIQLDTLNVETNDLTGPFVAVDTSTGMKMDVPLREVPQSVSVVTRQQMQDRGVQTLSDAIDYSAGVSASPYGEDARFEQFVIRGFDENLLGVYRDGMRLPTAGFAGFRQEPYGLQRVDILRGPTSTLYGLNNPGGLVNLVSKLPVVGAQFGEIWGSYGSFDTAQLGFDINGAGIDGTNITYRLTGLVREGNTQVDYVDNNRVYLAPTLTWTPNTDTTFTVFANYQRDRTGDTYQLLPAEGTLYPSVYGSIPPSRFLGVPGQSHYNADQYSAGYFFEHRADNGWTLRQNLRYASVDVDYLTVYPTSAYGGDTSILLRTAQQNDQTLGVFTIDNQAQYDSDLGFAENKLVFGLDYSNTQQDGTQNGGPLQSLITGTLPVSPINPYFPIYSLTIDPLINTLNTTQDLSQTGIYAQDMLKIHDKWVLTFGGRYDWVSTESTTQSPVLAQLAPLLKYYYGVNVPSYFKSNSDDSAFSGRVGLSYLFDNGLTPYVSYASSFNVVPGFTQSSVTVDTAYGPLPISYDMQPLKPETGEQYELGMKYQPNNGKSYIQSSIYQITKQNAVSFDTTDPMQMAYYQTGEIQVRGFELEAAMDFENGFKVLAAYTYLHAEVTEDMPPAGQASIVGNVPERVPEHLASAWLDYTFQEGALKGFGLGGGARYVGATWGDRANTIYVPSYTLYDAALRYTKDNWLFSLTAKNLLDNYYVGTCSSIGNTYIGCSYGQTRTVTAQVTYRW
ncbi:TonB-dependent siderophore receptor [Xanthobacter agilis]|uniref:TonB-dependent siderophore receptor n=1 Tax=Xanthobacter agilis TaxID=47492 RepID=UPI0037291854